MRKLMVFLLFALLTIPTALVAGEVKLMDKDELKAMLGSPDLVVFDVRLGRDWSSSEFKIIDAVRLTDEEMTAAMGELAKDKTLVFYCA